MPDYIPQADASFDTWQTNFVTFFNANAAVLGFNPLVDVPALAVVQTDWNGAYAAHTAAQASAQGATGAPRSAGGVRLERSPHEIGHFAATIRDRLGHGLGARERIDERLAGVPRQALDRCVHGASQVSPAAATRPGLSFVCPLVLSALAFVLRLVLTLPAERSSAGIPLPLRRV